MPTEIVKHDPNITKVRELLSSPGIMNAIVKAAPKHMTAERMIAVAMTMVKKSAGLRNCDPFSIVGSIVEASQLGLECDGVLGQAYLVPFFSVFHRFSLYRVSFARWMVIIHRRLPLCRRDTGILGLPGALCDRSTHN